MSKRVVVLGALAAGLLLLGGQGAASANVMWCMSDPPIQVVTPGGHNLSVNNMVYLSPLDRHIASQITDGAIAAPDGRGGTLITVHMYIPSSAHGANVVSSNYRYDVTDTGGTRNGGVTLTLTLDVPAT
jgi:phosphatidylserine decarboxylase